jgi:hypothetical protein
MTRKESACCHVYREALFLIRIMFSGKAASIPNEEPERVEP